MAAPTRQGNALLHTESEGTVSIASELAVIMIELLVAPSLSVLVASVSVGTAVTLNSADF